MDAENYIESLEAQSQANNTEEEIETKQNPYSKRNAMDKVDEFDKKTQDNLVQYRIGKVDEFNINKPTIYEIRANEPDGGWERYIQKKYVDVEGEVSEWEVVIDPNYKDTKGNSAKLHKTRFKLQPSIESIEKRKQMVSSGIIAQPILTESELTKKIENLAFSALQNKDEDREKIKSQTLADLKGLKEFIVPENSKDKDNLTLELIKMIANKKESKDDGSSILLEMQKQQQEFNNKILEMQKERYDDQVKSLRKENNIKEQYEEVIKNTLSKVEKKQSLMEQIDDIDKLAEFAKKLGYEKTGGGGEKEAGWKDILSDGLKEIIPALPSIAEKIAGMFINRQVAVGNFNPNMPPANSMPTNNLLPNNPVYAPAGVPVNNNPAPMPTPTPTPAPALQVNASILRSLALLNALDLSFNAYREYSRNKDKKDIKPDVLEDLTENMHNVNMEVYDKLADVQPTLLDNLDRIDIAVEIRKFINDTKQLYPDFNEKINSILATGWLKELSDSIMKEAGFEPVDTETKDEGQASAN